MSIAAVNQQCSTAGLLGIPLDARGTSYRHQMGTNS